MLLKNRASKVFCLLFFLGLSLSTASAADLSLEDDTVWLNRNDRSHVEGSIEAAGNIVLNTTHQSQEYIVADSNGSIRTSNFSSLALTNYQLHLYVNGSKVESRTVEIRKFKVKVENSGTGFVGTKMGRVEYTEPVKLRLKLVGGKQKKKIEKETITIDNFFFTSPEASIAARTDVDAVQQPDNPNDVRATIYAKINQDTATQAEKLNLVVEYSREGADFSVEKKINPFIFQMRGKPVGDRPADPLDYNSIEDFSYSVDIITEGNDIDPTLYSEDFDLHVTRKKSGFNALDECKSNPSKQWLEAKSLQNSNADYRLSLSSIPQLKTGTYYFTVCLDPQDGRGKGDRATVIDSIRVRNGLKLSGRVVDSRNRGVRTEMVLRKGNTVIPVNTGADGTYYKEIETAKGKNTYDSVKLKFFDRGRSSPDATVNVVGVNFAAGERENLAGDSESVKFQYWNDPKLGKQAIEPVNMMAVKFAYPIAKKGHTARMKFDPADINTDKLKVFECSKWNFEGATCLGKWDSVPEKDVTINYQGWTANFPIDDPYLAENAEGSSKHILMNAYVVGVPSDLSLNSGIRVRGTSNGRVPVGGDITVTGRVISENNNFVKQVNVDVEFLEAGKKINTLEGRTDINGQFRISGEAPEEPGNYTVRVKLDKEGYSRFSQEFQNSFETYIKEGIELSLPSETLVIDYPESSTTDFTVENTGQRKVEDISLSVSGIQKSYVSLSRKTIPSISPGETGRARLTVDLPDGYCSGGCPTYPSFTLKASGKSNGKKVSAEKKIFTQINVKNTATGSSTDNSGENQQETTQESSSGENQSNSISGAFSESISGLEKATGDFLASQSSLNLALGLLMIFFMVLAGAIKKKQEGGGRAARNGRMAGGVGGNRSGGSRPAIQQPQVSNQDNQVDQAMEEVAENMDDGDEDEVESKIDEIAEAVDREETTETREPGEAGPEKTADSGEEAPGNECSVCGEEFDTESARELHEQAIHEE